MYKLRDFTFQKSCIKMVKSIPIQSSVKSPTHEKSNLKDRAALKDRQEHFHVMPYSVCVQC